MAQFPGFSPFGNNRDDVGMTDAEDESTGDGQHNATISRTADQFRNALKISPTKLSIPNPLRNYFAVSAVVDPNFSAPAAASMTCSSSSSAPPAALPMTPVYTPPPPLVPEPEKPSQQVDTPRPKPQARNKVPLEKGYSQMFWLRLIQSETDLAGLKGASPRRLLSMDEVKKHTSEGEAWTVLRGRVYNVSPYLKFHPGGSEMLMKAAGKDGTALFNKYHSWVNAEFLLEKCMVGVLDVQPQGAK